MRAFVAVVVSLLLAGCAGMVTPSNTVSRPEVSEIVRGVAKMAESKTMESTPPTESAFRIACRSEPLPASLVLITVNVAGAIRSSKTCNKSRAPRDRTS